RLAVRKDRRPLVEAGRALWQAGDRRRCLWSDLARRARPGAVDLSGDRGSAVARKWDERRPAFRSRGAGPVDPDDADGRHASGTHARPHGTGSAAVAAVAGPPVRVEHSWRDAGDG